MVLMKVKIYSTSWCPYCHALMDWLDQKGVEYDVIDAEDLLDDNSSTIKSVPATEINGQLIFGFDRPAITSSLQEAGIL